MKNILLVFAMIVFGTTIAQEKPKEVKEETKVKTVKVKTDEGTTERKVKVVTRETGNVELDEKDKNKVNQDRRKSPVKVEKTTSIDNDSDAYYDISSKETYYKLDDEGYMFSPNKKGFDIAYSNKHSRFINIGRAWNTSSGKHYIVHENKQKGIGYFDTEGNFVVEYYNKNTDVIEVKTYNRSNSN